ncbi:carboxypeptidase M32 [Clostridium intestinale]|uniref:Metal-dependent carboxypeptidase n=1 Tax=Clostridium intestinale DSM 6191 TaxID=1121320 RepID=A0A1M6ER81_9CLOT|nr:carboxypeptidase M32 [Clostridium intestinale]SHI87916.1 carboxypeptidase Taq [Clostridium intestinale DSM 6191]
MEKKLEQKLVEFKEYIKTMEITKQAIDLIYWDKLVCMPKKAVEGRAEVIGFLSEQLFNQQTSKEMREFLKSFKENSAGLSQVDKAMIKRLYKEYNETKKIPVERYKEFVILTSKSEAAWEEAKDKNDFNIFKPYLSKVVNFQKEFVGYWGYKDHKYNTLLDKYEEGITVEVLDKVFGDLRDALVELLNKIKKSKITINADLLNSSYDKEKQKELSLYALKLIGFDMEAGRLDESTHPFTTNFTNKDVRLTTHYYEHDLLSALFSTIHEGGHGIYEQNISDDLQNTWLSTGASMGIHESQSRFYENIIGRSEEFLRYLYPKIKELFKNFDKIDFNEFYKVVNKVEPSLIRTEADELTYSLHVIIRYEIEKALFNDEITVEELPEVWKKKYKEYLGVEPDTDSLGVLQDMHWSDGSFGYFPSYALGNLYGAQIFNTMKKDSPDVYELIAKGDIISITKWLKDNVHKYGSLYSPKELILKVTGEELNSQYFIDYLEEKYSKLYGI